MGTMAGGIVLAKLAQSGVSEFGGTGTLSKAEQKAAWIENGLIDAGGSHEPYLFTVRRGGQSLDARQLYERAQSEEVIAELKAQGVEVFHTHLYKGFGMVVEKPEMEDTVRTAAIVHRLGLKIDTYIQWDTMMYETLLAEESRAEQWFQRNASGQPIMIEYGFQQSFRYLPCFSNQEYLDYLKKVVHYAVVEVKTDFIHFDNFALSAEPNSCHCPACKTGFRRRLQTKYSPTQRKERFGFENVDFVNPPRWNNDNRPEKLKIIADPVFQEWIDYRCQTMANALEQMASLIKSINPEVVVEIDYGGFVGQNFPWTRGIDHARLFPFTQVFWDESDRDSEYLPDGRLISAIRTYKMARSYRNIVLSYIAGNEVRTGEALAFNQTIGFAGESPLSEQMQRYISFYRKQREFFLGAIDVAPVRVLHSFASITYNNAAAGLSAILVEQALIQARIPFQIVFDEHLDDLSPKDCKTLILPNSECLSDQQIAAIHRYVNAGGGLVVTEQSGLYDAWRRARPESGLLGLVDNQARGEGRRGRNEKRAENGAASTRKQFGAGRVAYLPRAEFDGETPAPEAYFFVGPEFWKRPANWKELIDAVSWAADDELELYVAGPDFLVGNLVEQPATHHPSGQLRCRKHPAGQRCRGALCYRQRQRCSERKVILRRCGSSSITAVQHAARRRGLYDSAHENLLPGGRELTEQESDSTRELDG